MSIDSDTVKNVAHLARLTIAEENLQRYAEDMSNTLDLANQLQQIDTDGIAPLANPLDRSQRLREDSVQEANQRDKLQQNAPKKEAGLFLVPKVVE